MSSSNETVDSQKKGCGLIPECGGTPLKTPLWMYLKQFVVRMLDNVEKYVEAKVMREQNEARRVKAETREISVRTKSSEEREKLANAETCISLINKICANDKLPESAKLLELRQVFDRRKLPVLPKEGKPKPKCLGLAGQTSEAKSEGDTRHH